jgi:hypothetical protein
MARACCRSPRRRCWCATMSLITITKASRSTSTSASGSSPTWATRAPCCCATTAPSRSAKPSGEAFLKIYFLERACEAQILALSAGEAKLNNPPQGAPEVTAQQGKLGLKMAAGALAWPALLRKGLPPRPKLRDLIIIRRMTPPSSGRGRRAGSGGRGRFAGPRDKRPQRVLQRARSGRPALDRPWCAATWEFAESETDAPDPLIVSFGCWHVSRFSDIRKNCSKVLQRARRQDDPKRHASCTRR